MNEDEAALLAELRAISDRSSINRFQNVGVEDITENELNENDFSTNPQPPKSDASAEAEASEAFETPSYRNHTPKKKLSIQEQEAPWKRKKSPQPKSAPPAWKKPKKPEKNNSMKTEITTTTSYESQPNQTTDEIKFERPVLPITTDENIDVGNGKGGFKSSVASTFKGERGGAAEDEELLALLRGVSSKSSSSRFQQDDGDVDNAASLDVKNDDNVGNDSDVSQVAAKASATPPWKKGKKKSAAVPPWKKPKPKKADGNGLESVDVVVAAAPPTAIPEPSLGAEVIEEDVITRPASPPLPARQNAMESEEGGFKSSVTSTFKGERGGAAEDEELLALLRGVSSKSSGSRFQHDNDENENNVSVKDPRESSKSSSAIGNVKDSQDTRNDQVISSKKSQAVTVDSSLKNSVAVEHSSSTPAEIHVDSENLLDSLASKNWKMRKAAYNYLILKLNQAVEDGAESGNVDGNLIMNSLDSAVLTIVKDSNAGALDTGLIFANLYAEHCRGATSSDHASSIASALLKGSGLSSTRQSTAKSSRELLLKLMEVGENGPSSVNSVVDILLKQGVTARKPKLVITSSELIMEAALSFGAACLPVASIAANAPKMLSHANADVREAGMNIVAEICRAVRSRDPLQNVIDKMKKAQLAQLDLLLEKQPEASVPQIGLRCQKSSDRNASSPEDLIAALEASAKEEEAKRLASRPAVNIFKELVKTDYETKLKLPKWSEKVAALDILIACGGEKPFKLEQPSSSVSYVELIGDLKKLLSHTHFAVNSKSMSALSMLAVGVGEKLYPYLRPLLPVLTGLSKDKKLTKAVGECLDTFFGNILSFDHLLEKDDALPTALNEQKEKNALARKSTLEFLQRCIQRGESAGRRGLLSEDAALRSARLASKKLSDTDASARKAAMNVLKELLSSENSNIVDNVDQVVEELKTNNPRAYKTLSAGTKAKTTKGSKDNNSPASKATAASCKTNKSVSTSSSISSSTTTRKSSSGASKPSGKTKDKPRAVPSNNTQDNDVFSEKGQIPELDDALNCISSFQISDWDSAEDEGGILSGLQSSSWKRRKAAIENLSLYIKDSSPKDKPSLETLSSAVTVVVKANTKSFQESNFNVMKAIMDLFLSLCDIHAEVEKPLSPWICKEAVKIAVEKIADRKFSQQASPLLTASCVVQLPRLIVLHAIKSVEDIKSPLPHEALLKWCATFCKDFGAAILSNSVKDVLSWVLKESGGNNPNVRKACVALISELHVQLGPVIKALVVSSIDTLPSSIKSQIEKTFQSSPFDPNSAKEKRPKTCVVLASTEESTSSRGGSGISSSEIEIPKVDLVETLPKDCISRMSTKEGKTAWKIRKQALEEVSAALEKSGGLISSSSSSISSLVELIRALRERMNDSQSNLKPVAAKLIGSILSCVDTVGQAKLGKIAFSPLVNAVINDNKKLMREASLDALKMGTQKTELDGGGPNPLSHESLIAPLVSEINGSEYKGGGLPDILSFLVERAEFLPQVDSLTTSKAQLLEQQFAKEIVSCLTSSKSETRSTAEDVLKKCVEVRTLSVSSIQKGLKTLLPAQQRTITSIIKSLQILPPSTEKESIKESPRKSVTAGRLQRKSRTSSVISPNLKKSQVRSRSSTRAGRSGSATRAGRDNSVTRAGRTTSSSRIGHLRKESNKLQQQSLEDSSLDATDNLSATTTHPLFSKNAGSSSKNDRSSQKRDNWSEFPEEPSGNEYLSSLKKLWSPHIPSSSTAILFPSKGIRKQQDAIAGSSLLENAIQISKDESDDIVTNQLDLILKWITISLCSREHTAGLQAILNLVTSLFTHLTELDYQMTDYEASIFLPYLLEKGSIAKGRFKDIFQDLISSIALDPQKTLYSPQKFGQLICIPLIERSGTAKARLVAMNQCCKCVNSVGLSAVGKKGVLTITRLLSEDKLPENRTAALDVIESVITKMNGDIQKFFRVCGKSNLSDKAKDLVQERWDKHHRSEDSVCSEESPKPKLKEYSRNPSQHTTNPKLLVKMKSESSRRGIAAPSPRTKSSSISQIPGRKDQQLSTSRNDNSFLPALKFKLGTESASSDIASYTNDRVAIPTTGPFTFNYDTTDKCDEANVQAQYSHSIKHDERKETTEVENMIYASHTLQDRAVGESLSLPRNLQSTFSHELTLQTADLTKGEPPVDNPPNLILPCTSLTKTVTTDSAASLRARFQQIREKHRSSKSLKHTNDGGNCKEQLPLPPTSQTFCHEESPYLSANKTHHNTNDSQIIPPNPPQEDTKKEAESPVALTSQETREYYTIHNTVEILLTLTIPISDNDEKVDKGVEALKKLHASISNSNDGLNNLEVLRNDVFENISDCIQLLTSVILFSFKCGMPSNNEGISFTLLSVTLATLMAIFRDVDLAHAVSQNALASLIHETATGLLDPRLASSSFEPSTLEASSRAKLVRAMNKLAIQASTGTKTHTSLQALMSLQLLSCKTTITDRQNSSGGNTSERLSRIITKLFTKVIKTEENKSAPFLGKNVDMLALLRSIEDMLSDVADIRKELTADFEGTTAPCTNIAEDLVNAIMRSELGENGAISIKDMLTTIHINPSRSFVGKMLFQEGTNDKNEPSSSPLASSSGIGDIQRISSFNTEDDTKAKVAQLLSTVGKSPEGTERTNALYSLSNFLASREEYDIEPHLKHLSAPFRAYILQQLKELSKENATTTADKPKQTNIDLQNQVVDKKINYTQAPSELENINVTMQPRSMGVSERIRFLKSKLNATEAAVQSSLDAEKSNKWSPTSNSDNSEFSISTLSKSTSHSRSSKNNDESPTLLTHNSKQRNSVRSLSSLRERLAAAHENGATSSVSSVSITETTKSPVGSSAESNCDVASSMGPAAALRARLQAVKNKRQANM